MLTTDQATLIILSHAGRDTSLDKPGFLDMLRPYNGLREETFIELLAAIVAVSPNLRADCVPRSLIHALWTLCSRAALWGIATDGMLRRNHLITDADSALLQRWVRILESTVERVMGGRFTTGEALCNAAEYIAERSVLKYMDVFLPAFIEGLGTADADIRRTMAMAIGTYGPAASEAIESLRTALSTTVNDVDEATAIEVANEIRATISKLGGRGL